jgi:hypothetical protein
MNTEVLRGDTDMKANDYIEYIPSPSTAKTSAYSYVWMLQGALMQFCGSGRGWAFYRSTANLPTITITYAGRPVGRVMMCERTEGGSGVKIIANIAKDTHMLDWSPRPSIPTADKTVHHMATAILNELSTVCTLGEI